ncbi:MAG: VWA domain-containing protein [Flavobacteriales bacterium]|nr:VWA domain-containing protein [Flavobacteriales bacterium]
MKTTNRILARSFLILLMTTTIFFIQSCTTPETVEEGQLDYTYVPSEKVKKYAIEEEEYVYKETFLEQKERSNEEAEPVAIVNRESKVVLSSKKVVNQSDYEQVAEEIFIPVYDSLKYNGVTVNYFCNLSSRLGGKPYFAEDADSLKDIIMEILSTELDDGTDIVLLIDKTGSMQDDVDAVKISLKTIMDYLSNFENVRLGIASYSDKNYHHDFWYNRIDLDYDLQKLEDFMDGYVTIGNPDTKESVNDAIVKTVREMNWAYDNKRLMLVIGDAPSQTGDLSDNTVDNVIAVCDSMEVQFNLYPVIINAKGRPVLNERIETDFAKVYPNPAQSQTTIVTSGETEYWYSILDSRGVQVKNGKITSHHQNVIVSDLPSGAYLFEVRDWDMDSYFTEYLIVHH